MQKAGLLPGSSAVVQNAGLLCRAQVPGVFCRGAKCRAAVQGSGSRGLLPWCKMPGCCAGLRFPGSSAVVQNAGLLCRAQVPGVFAVVQNAGLLCRAQDCRGLLPWCKMRGCCAGLRFPGSSEVVVQNAGLLCRAQVPRVFCRGAKCGAAVQGSGLPGSFAVVQNAGLLCRAQVVGSFAVLPNPELLCRAQVPLIFCGGIIVHSGTRCHLFSLSFITGLQSFACAEYQVDTVNLRFVE